MTSPLPWAPPPRLARRAATAAVATVAWLAGAADASGQGRPEAPDVQAEASIVVDAESGTVIAADEANERLPIASATKLMTALLTLERTDPGDVFAATGYDPAPVESQIGLRKGERMTVRDLLVALLLESANDAAMALARGIEGSTREFVAHMNRRAARLGLDDTSFANPIGFDAPRNYSTASDLALLARHLMEKQRFRDIVEEPSLELRSGDVPRTVDNRNDLVGESPLVEGVKTGHTLGAGHVLVGSAADDGNRVISVVLGAPGESTRDQASLELLRYGLEQFRERRVVRAGEPIASAAVAHHDGDSVELAAADRISVTVLRGEAVETRIDAPDEVEGPLPAGAEVGAVTVVHRGEVAGRAPLLTVAPVPGADLPTRVATTLGDHLGAVAAVVAVLCGALLLVAARARRTRERPGSRSVT